MFTWSCFIFSWIFIYLNFIWQQYLSFLWWNVEGFLESWWIMWKSVYRQMHRATGLTLNNINACVIQPVLLDLWGTKWIKRKSSIVIKAEMQFTRRSRVIYMLDSVKTLVHYGCPSTNPLDPTCNELVNGLGGNPPLTGRTKPPMSPPRTLFWAVIQLGQIILSHKMKKLTDKVNRQAQSVIASSKRMLQGHHVPAHSLIYTF